MKEALYWRKLKDGRVHCQLCPHYCIIAEGELGKCRVRKNVDGALYSLIYARATSVAMDPIEKKPLITHYPTSFVIDKRDPKGHIPFTKSKIIMLRSNTD